jgi:hypothetical protein
MSTIQVWTQLEKHQPEKVTLSSNADVDDLKQELLKNRREAKRNFYVFFKNIQLPPDAPVPSGSTCQEPIAVKCVSLSGANPSKFIVAI